MDEEFEEDGWMGRHRSGEDEVCSVCFGYCPAFSRLLLNNLVWLLGWSGRNYGKSTRSSQRMFA